jgi:hypothetical protein
VVVVVVVVVVIVAVAGDGDPALRRDALGGGATGISATGGTGGGLAAAPSAESETTAITAT